MPGPYVRERCDGPYARWACWYAERRRECDRSTERKAWWHVGREQVQAKPLAAIFDMDGTLINTEHLGIASWHRAARRQGTELSDEVIRGFIGHTRPWIIQQLASLTGDDELAVSLYEGHLTAQDELCATQLAFMPGAREVLELCRGLGIPVGLATTSTHAEVERHLGPLGGIRYFDAITCGEDVEHGKPAPDIYLLAARRAGVDPRDCVVAEDSFSGVRAAHAAGARVFMAPDLVQPTPEIKALTAGVLGSLSEFPQAAGLV